MKKLSIVLVFVLLLSLIAGCQGKNEPAGTTQAPATAAPTTQAPETTTSVTTEAVTTAAVTTEAQTTTEIPTTAEPVTQPETTEAPEPGDEDVHPMLFHVTGEGGQEMYLFGTIHVGDQQTGTALQKLSPFLEGCDALAVEFDLVAYEKDLPAQMEAMNQFILTDGSTVDQYMPAELYEQAAELLQQAQLYPNMMRRYNLSMWSQLVEQAALLTKSSLDSNLGMDRQLIQFCYEKQIPVRDVESPEFQYGLLADFSDELNLLMIENTLANLDDYGVQVDELYAAWLEGNYDHIVEVLSSESEDEEEMTEDQQALVADYNDKMLTQRNLGMRDKAVEWLTAGDKVFFAVGAAHLVDEGGLVELLRAAGYTVEQISY